MTSSSKNTTEAGPGARAHGLPVALPIGRGELLVRSIGLSDAGFGLRQGWLRSWIEDLDSRVYQNKASELSQIERNFDTLLVHGADGLRVIRIVRGARRIFPSKTILALIETDATTEKVGILNAGADDVLSLEMNPEEAAARLRAAARTNASVAREASDAHPGRGTLVEKIAAPVRFSTREKMALALLETNINALTTYSELRQALSGQPSAQSLYAMMCYLRAKLPSSFKLANVKGKGYRLESDLRVFDRDA